MKKNYLLLLFVSIIALNAKSQVTIGSQDTPDPGAILELKSTSLGFLPSRVSLVNPGNPGPLLNHVEGMVVFNKTNNDSLSAGLYYNSGTKWIKLSTSPFTTQNWFYMPSIAIKTPPEGATGIVVDLYAEFKKQLNTTGIKTSPNAPDKVLSAIPAATDLYYYVTAYDPLVFDIKSITTSGVMTYDVIDQVSDSTFMNIVFVEK